MTTSETVLYAVEDGVAQVTLNRPPMPSTLGRPSSAAPTSTASRRPTQTPG
jgi:enoyl-CoA hydratase/carnithine racemase